MMFMIIQLVLGLYGMVLCQTGDGSQKVEQQIQCYACGLPKVHPENDIIGSYGKKLYNHSCVELNKYNKLVQIQIKVNLCFCSNHLCNDPEGELFNGAALQSSLHERFLKIMIMVAMTHFWTTFRVSSTLKT